MSRFINFRALLFVFIGAALGAVFIMHVMNKNLTLFIVGASLTLLLTIYLIISFKNEKFKKFVFVNKFILCFIIGFFCFATFSYVNINTFSKNVEDINNAEVEARVCSVSEGSNYTYIILENCSIYDFDTQKEQKLSGKISIVTYNQDIEGLSVGDVITFKGSLEKYELIKDGKFNSYAYKYKLKYSCFVDIEDITFTKGEMNFDEKVREGVKKILFENLSFDNASIAFASIFGDKTLINYNLYNSFSVSGTAHLLCVSGLHVGFLIALLMLIFKLFKVNKKAILAILSIVLIFYCYLCGFSASVVRASIMGIVLCFSSAFGMRYDNLSSLSLAGLIILLFSPMSVYDVGFQLSFASCFGIILLMPTMTKFFKKINFDNKFSQSFSVTLCAQLGTFPIILHNFEKMSFLSVCANIIVVPLFSLLFSVLIVIVLINAILPLGFLFKIIELGLNLVILITKGFGAITNMVLNVSSFSVILTILFYCIILFISKFINLKTKKRILYICIFACVFAFTFVLQYFPANYNAFTIFNMSVTNSTLINNSKGEKVLINVGDGTQEDLKRLKTDLLDFKIIKINALILNDYNEEMQSCVVSICNTYDVDCLYLPDNLKQNAEKYLFLNLDNTKIFKTNNEFYSFDNFTFQIIPEIKGIYLNVLDKNVSCSFFLCENLNKTTANYLIKQNLDADIVKFNYLNEKYLATLSNFDTILCKSSNIRQSNIQCLNGMASKLTIR